MTISRRKKILGRLVDKISGKAELSTDRGSYLHDPSTRKLTKKQKRHSGRITPQILSPDMKFDEIKQNALEPEVFYDEWENYRDSFRDVHGQREIEEKKKKRKLLRKFKRFIKLLRLGRL